MSKYKDKIASGALALVVADTLPVQIDLMKEGLSAGQVGQRPFEMGYKVIYAIKDMKEGKPAPADPTYTGLDVCTPENGRHLHRRLIRSPADSTKTAGGASAPPVFVSLGREGAASGCWLFGPTPSAVSIRVRNSA